MKVITFPLQRFGLLIAMFGLFLIPACSSVLLAATSDDIGVGFTPESPEPYQNVTINLASTAVNLDVASIQWSQGSKVVLSGFGKTSYSLTAAGPDVPVHVTVVITPTGGAKIIKQISIMPSDMDVFWEAVDGYTPPFYRGKSFPSSESAIKVVAIPNTATNQAKKGNISFAWEREGDEQSRISGYKKNSFTFMNDVLKTVESVSVTASSVDNMYSASKTISIPIVSPKIIFYKESPTEGVHYGQALTDETSAPDDDTTIVAAPYFLALRGKENRYSYVWQINGEPIETPTQKNKLTIHPTSRGGSASIGLVIEDADALFQKVRGALKINL